MRRQRLEPLEDVASLDDAVLDDFSQALAELGLRQRSQRANVAKHCHWIAENAGQILARAQVDTGFAADRGVDHCDERGRDVEEGNAAHVGCGGEAE